MNAVHPAAPFQQEAVERSVVLIWLPAEERLYMQAVRADDQPGHGGELALPIEPHQEGLVTGRVELYAQTGQHSPEFPGRGRAGPGRAGPGRAGPGTSGHASTP